MNQTVPICVIGCSIRPFVEEIFHIQNTEIANDHSERLNLNILQYFDYFNDTDSVYYAENTPLTLLTPGKELLQVAEFIKNHKKNAGSSTQWLSWLILGGFDNCPDLYQLLESQNQVLLGKSLSQLMQLRSPSFWEKKLPSLLGPFLPETDQDRCPPGRWFLKQGIQKVSESEIVENKASKTNSYRRIRYWQKAIDGCSVSSLHFLNSRCQNQHSLLGFSYQETTPKNNYRYLGNFYCQSINEEIKRAGQWERAEEIGACVGTVGISGFFGIDWVWKNGFLWPLEINPRPTASIELYSKVFDRLLVGDQFRSFFGTNGTNINSYFDSENFLDKSFGKRILYRKGSYQKNILAKLQKWLTSQKHITQKDSKAKGFFEESGVWWNRCYDFRSISPPPEHISLLAGSGLSEKWIGEDLSIVVRFADIPAANQIASDGDPICTALIEIHPKTDQKASKEWGEEKKKPDGEEEWTLFQYIGGVLEQKINVILETE